MFKRFSLIYLLLTAATFALVVSLFLTLNVLSNELEKQQHKYRENITWSVSQLEREGMLFIQKLLLLSNGDPQVSGENVQQAFDIFWSRTETLQHGQAGKVVAQLTDSGRSNQLFIQIQTALEHCDPLVVRIVQGDASLVEMVYQKFQPLMSPMHHFVQEIGNTAMWSQEQDRQRFLLIKRKAVGLLLASLCSGTLLAFLLLTRQRALGRLHDSLEQQVIQRTEELSKTNRALNDEVISHRQARDEMRGLRNLLENIINLMPSQLVGVDEQGKVMLWNRQKENASGVVAAEALHLPLEQVHPGLARWLADSHQDLALGKVVFAHKRPYPGDSSDILVDILAYPLSGQGQGGVVIRIDDVTEQAKIDEHMIHSEKMVSVGVLAAGMAHEINNPLAGVVQNLQVIEQRIDANFETNKKAALKCGTSMEGIRRYFEERKLTKLFDGVRESAQKAVKIVNNLQCFSRRDRGGFEFCSVLDLLDYSLDLVRNDCRLSSTFDFNRIAIVKDYKKDISEIECQANQLQQVFFNILKNAVQAMSTFPATDSEPQIALRVSSDQEYVRIEIQDNGPGMEDAVRRRVYEPFFTTKEVGSGTGLGLSVSYMIVCEKHGGSMDVESTPGQGSRFIISVPCVQIKDLDTAWRCC